MRLNRLCLVCSTLFAVVSIALCVYAVHKARLAREAEEATAQAQSDLVAQLQEARRVGASKAKELASLKGVLAKLEGQKASAKPALSPNDRLMRLFATHPKLRDLELESYRANLLKRYGPLYQEFKLSADQIAKFGDLATAHEYDRENLYAEAINTGVDTSSPAFAQMRQKLNDDYYATVAAQVAPDLSQRLTGVDAMADRGTVMLSVMYETNSLIRDDSSVMSSAQYAASTKLLIEASGSYQSGGDASVDSVNWEAALQKEGSILTPDQISALKTEAALLKMSADVKAFFAAQSGHP